MLEDQPSSSLDVGKPSENVSESETERIDDAKPVEELRANIGNNSKKKRPVKAIGDKEDALGSVQSGDGTSPEIENRRRKKSKKIKLSFEAEVET